MSLYRRGGTWWVRFTAPNGDRVQRSARTTDRVKAQHFHDQLKADLWKTYQLGARPRRVWQEAVVRWVRETSHKATYQKDQMHLRWLDRHLRGITLTDINRDVVDRLMQARISDGVSNATVNRTFEVLRAILRRAVNEWEWLDRAPRIRMLPEPKRRIRWLTHEEAQRLLAELPTHLQAMVRFSLATGLRQRNVMELEWSQVNLKRRQAWIHPDQAKARRAIAVPLNAEAMVVLREVQGNHPRRVFTYKGEPVRQVNTRAWTRALERAGIKDFRWHDLRHTWASWHVQAGTPLNVLQELGGWESEEMVRRYAHLAPSQLAEYAEQLARPQAVRVTGTNLVQSR
jgi:integrase